MRIWLITIGEPFLPTEQGPPRLMRTGILAGMLCAEGHEVTWWVSAFDHYRKRAASPERIEADRNARPRVLHLHGIAYQRNIGLRRLVNHLQLARDFRRHAELEQVPDLLLCSLPTLELSAEAVRYGKRHGKPVLLDIRDLWPDVFQAALPSWLHGLLLPYERMARFALGGAEGLIAVSKGYLDWGLAKAGRQAASSDGVFPLAYDENQGMDLDEPPAREPGDCTLCWFVGSFGHSYDLATPIQAARLLRESGDRRFRFVFTGDGEQRALWEQLAQGLDNVHFEGWSSRSQIRAQARAAHVGLLAYRSGATQGLPNKLVEYLAYGLPVLSSLEGESETLLRAYDCGRQYRSGDPQSFIDALTALTAPGQLSAARGRATNLFHQRFRAEACYKSLITLLEIVAGGLPKPSRSCRRI